MNAYTDEYDTYIAEDLEDLQKMVPYDFEEDTWIELNPSGDLTIVADPDLPEDDWIRETKTIAEWIESNGRGLLCSTEW